MAQEEPNLPLPNDGTPPEQAALPAPPQPANDDNAGAVQSAPQSVSQPFPAANQRDPFLSGRPPHSQTKSTLAPTSEFTRLLLLAFTSRYVLRSLAELFAETFFHADKTVQEKVGQFTYSLSMGVGSGILSMRYNALVKSDIKNIFCEAVAYEKGGSPDSITLKDIARSDNLIAQRTMHNYREKSFKRLGTDALFFLATPLFKVDWPRNKNIVTDLLVGIKGGTALAETWNRKTTMFEDLITFVNNKINPRNGLGQPITEGEIFDLYQHYSDDFHPDKMFQNLLPHDAAEAQVWARSEPIFQRITELMNHTYAYKHNVVLGDNSKPDANFALPKFIYLLGHDLIKPRQPEQTRATIEIANQYGIPAVKEMQSMLASGMSLEQVAQRFPLAPDQWAVEKPAQEPNKVIAKGSTMQLERSEQAAAIPLSTIHSIQSHEPPALAASAALGTAT